VQFLSASDKDYVAEIRFGVTTDTYDVTGEEVRRSDVVPTRAAIEAALRSWQGEHLQAPPPFSAKKIGGTPAYLLARLQKTVEIKPVQVTVRELELIRYAGGLATVRVVCSSGFYVRSLAHDLGQRLGCGAHLETLRRTRAGEFTIGQAVALETIAAEGPDAISRLVPMADLLSRLPHVVVNERGAWRAAHGNALAVEDLWDADRTVAPSAGAGPVRVLDAGGALLAIGQAADTGLLQPVVVLV
jgi:tRNA pseudouridine55 synthase